MPILHRLLSVLRWIALGAVTLLPLQAGQAVAQSSAIELRGFFRVLERDGNWLLHDRYGEVWVPQVQPGWRPYTLGRWVHTEEHGWFWESDEPFGWAVYHYGRWHLDGRYGWLWVPDDEWGPAWVAWRHDDEHVGWAPLPPEARWTSNGLHFTSSFYDSPGYASAWCFVPVSHLTSDTVWAHIAPLRRNRYYLNRTEFVRTHQYSRFGMFDRGFDRNRWERLSGRRIVNRRITNFGQPFRDGRGRGDEVRVFRRIHPGGPRDRFEPVRRDPRVRPDWVDRGSRPRPDWRDRSGRGDRDWRDNDRTGRPDRTGPRRGERVQGPGPLINPGPPERVRPDRRGPGGPGRDVGRGPRPSPDPGPGPTGRGSGRGGPQPVVVPPQGEGSNPYAVPRQEGP